MKEIEYFENKYPGIEFKSDGYDGHPFHIEDFFNALQIETDIKIQSLYFFTLNGLLDDVLRELKAGIDNKYEKWVDMKKISGVMDIHQSDRYYNDWTLVMENWNINDHYYKRFESLEREMVDHGIKRGMEFLCQLHERDSIELCYYNEEYWVGSGYHRISIAKRANYPKVYAEIIYLYTLDELNEIYEDALQYLAKLMSESSNKIDFEFIKNQFVQNLSVYQKSTISHYNKGTKTIQIKRKKKR